MYSEIQNSAFLVLEVLSTPINTPNACVPFNLQPAMWMYPVLKSQASPLELSDFLYLYSAQNGKVASNPQRPVHPFKAYICPLQPSFLLKIFPTFHLQPLLIPPIPPSFPPAPPPEAPTGSSPPSTYPSPYPCARCATEAPTQPCPVRGSARSCRRADTRPGRPPCRWCAARALAP